MRGMQNGALQKNTHRHVIISYYLINTNRKHGIRDCCSHSIEKFTMEMTSIYSELLVVRFLSHFRSLLSVSQNKAKTNSHLAKKRLSRLD